MMTGTFNQGPTFFRIAPNVIRVSREFLRGDERSVLRWLWFCRTEYGHHLFNNNHNPAGLEGYAEDLRLGQLQADLLRARLQQQRQEEKERRERAILAKYERANRRAVRRLNHQRRLNNARRNDRGQIFAAAVRSTLIHSHTVISCTLLTADLFYPLQTTTANTSEYRHDDRPPPAAA